jgi:YlmC/YmxH family sporulation protein
MKQKEVINIKDGTRLGYICDIEVDMVEGKILKIIIPGAIKMFHMFSKETEYQIEWEKIKKIGEDIILVEVDLEKDLVECK